MKRSRNEAQQAILELSRDLSAALLPHENAAFTAIEREFRIRIPDVPLKTVAGVRNNHDLREAFVDAHTDAIDSASGWVRRLARLSGDRALVSIRRQLQLCEEALAARYAGITERAMMHVDPGPIGKIRAEEWLGAMQVHRNNYRVAQTHQIAQAKDMDELRLRLFSETPSGIRGHNQRGVWWNSVTAGLALARTVAIGTTNDVSNKAMVEFNRAGG